MSLIHRAWIPYPQPPSSVELRSGHLYNCQCVKRDGLQQDCPRTGCQGRPPCLAFPAPLCAPSGNAPPEPPCTRKEIPDGPPHYRQRIQDLKQKKKNVQGVQQQNKDAYKRTKVGGTDLDEKLLRMGREGYVDNPPAKPRRVPCPEHRKTRS